MSTWRELLYMAGHRAENSLDDLKLRFRERMGWDTVAHICPYMSFGNKNFLYIKGRVMHDRSIQTDKQDDFWDNLANMYCRLNSHEIKGAKLRVVYHDVEKEFFSDEDGYFGVDIPMPDAARTIEGWHYPEIELLDAPIPFDAPVKTKAKVLVPPAAAKYGVISDIDDTILKTNATSLIKLAWNTFAHNSHTRTPFPGVAAFYQALHHGVTGNEKNPFFYVSSSPWNLYDLLSDFINLKGIPEGPLFLKDYGFTHNKIFTEGHEGHKPKKIKKVMDAFPEMKFILIGDSGQKDPEIYADIIKTYPERILAVYIRDVTVDERDIEVKNIYTTHKMEMVYSDNSFTAAQHAAEAGFINSEMLPEIARSNENLDVREE
jgi:phosphatidate phosphatase APP1